MYSFWIEILKVGVGVFVGLLLLCLVIFLAGWLGKKLLNMIARHSTAWFLFVIIWGCALATVILVGAFIYILLVAHVLGFEA